MVEPEVAAAKGTDARITVGKKRQGWSLTRFVEGVARADLWEF